MNTNALSGLAAPQAGDKISPSSIDLNKFLSDKITRDIKTLYIEFIYIIEDYLADGKLTDAEFQRARKKILDRGNNVVRTMTTQLNELDITLKKTI
jgi:hypothetical protein